MRELILRLGASLLGGALAYSIWLTVVLSGDWEGTTVGGKILLALVPIISSVGFTVGLWLREMKAGLPRRKFLWSWYWMLAGCVLGALVSYPFGRMLTVFGIFIIGIVAVLLRELAIRMKPDAGICGPKS